MIERFPFLSLHVALIILRTTTALLFMAHAGTRIAVNSIPQFGAFMETRGFPQGELWVWAITVAELICGTALIVGKGVRWATIPLAAIAIGGIMLIHAQLGWFVGEHGTGGSEYSVALIVALLVIAAADRDRRRRKDEISD